MSSSLSEAALVAVGAFASTNVDNLLVTSAQLAGARRDRVGRILTGQATAAAVTVAVAAGAAVVLFDVPTHWIGLLGFVPILLGLRGLFELRDPERRAVDPARRSAGGFIAAFLVTLGISGDNLAVYIPVFRVGDLSEGAVTVAVFAGMELVLCGVALALGRHPATLRVLDRLGVYAVPVLYVIIGVVVLLRAHTFGGP
jgi:cadmium resistance protein CadD (predicted permease)